MTILNIFGIANAYAAAAAPASTEHSLLSMLPLFLILIFFMYFMIIRPQSKRAKAQKDLLGNLKKGDEVVTAGGILGTIEKISNDFIVLKIAEETKIKIQKSSVSSFMPKGTAKSVE